MRKKNRASEVVNGMVQTEAEIKNQAAAIVELCGLRGQWGEAAGLIRRGVSLDSARRHLQEKINDSALFRAVERISADADARLARR